MRKLTILFIDLYRSLVSPFFVLLFGHGCRFNPTCSEYSREAIKKFGLLRGISLSLRRFGKCHPFGSSGFDPVPESL